MKSHRFLRLCTLFLVIAVCFAAVPVSAEESEEEGETLIVHIDSVNGTRWENTTCVYIGRATTEQNEWGYNILVDANGIVTGKIVVGDLRGRNLAIPDGGFVFSSVADDVKKLMEGISVGDHILFDSYGSRVLISKNEIDPFYEVEHSFTGYNGVRYDNMLIVYSNGGTKTGTNGWGYEVCVGRDGIILSSGGNDSVVPEGGFVLSAIEPADRSFLKTYCIVGAKCVLSGMKFKVYYGPEMLANTVMSEKALMRERIAEAEADFRLIDAENAYAVLDAIPTEGIDTLERRNEVLEQIKDVGLLLVESPKAGIVSVWYVPTEKTAEQVKETVSLMKEMHINQVCIGISNGYDTIVKLPARFPFATRADVKDVDLLAVYAEECRKNGIELVVSMPVFSCPDKDYKHNDWLAKPNQLTAGNEKFYSPANDEYMAYLKEYVEYVITRYDIDGFQYDYIRYPYFDGATDYGYDDATKTLFLQKTGLSEADFGEIKTKLRAAPHWNEWVQFKRDLVSSRVSELTALIREKRPDLYISACLADDTGKDVYFQDGKKWVEDGLVDGIYPMSYGEGIMANSTKRFAFYDTDRSFLVMGSGAYLSLSQEEIIAQTLQTRQNFADGIAYFEWSAYVLHGYAEKLASLYANEPVSFTADEKKAVGLLIETAKERFARYSGKAEQTAELFEGTTDPAEIKEALTALVPYDEKLYFDLDLAIRVQNFSREQYKGTAELLPHETDPEPTESSEEPVSEPQEESESSASESTEKKPFPIGWVIGGAAAVLLAAAAGIFLFKKRKK